MVIAILIGLNFDSGERKRRINKKKKKRFKSGQKMIKPERKLNEKSKRN